MKEGISYKKQFLAGSKVEIEKRIIPTIALLGMIISFVGYFVNLLLDLDSQMTTVVVLAFIIYTASYFVAKFSKYLNFSKWIVISITLVIINLLWYYNYGARGPALYLFVIIYSFFVFIFDRREAVVLTIIVFLNLGVLFVLEYRNPNIVGHYAADRDRILDVYTALIYYSFIFFVYISIVRKAYFSEYKKAKMADQLKSSFLANMSHEIRTPLNAIVGFSNILADENLTAEEKKQYATIINGSNDSLLRLVNDILDVSMVESDQLNLVIKNCDISNLMDNLEKTYLLKLNNEVRKIHIFNNTTQGHVFINTDCDRLQQVLVNLLDNAIKYTEEGEIEFGFTVEEKDIKFYVKDTGIGIKETHIKYLFDRFYKVEDDNSKLFRGTGIGLYLSKRLVNMLGGRIWVNSKFGKGTTFYFAIPKVDFRAEEMDGFQSGNTHNPLVGTKKRFTILIIEDQESNQQYYTALLKPGDFRLIQAHDGTEGVEAFEEHPETDLILLDLKMPDIDGFEVLDMIRKKDTEVPIIAQTAYAMSSDREKCLEAGFTDFIAKPVKRDTMFRLINKYIHSA